MSDAEAGARDSRHEARQRFDRGLALYNSGDLMGALAEFRHAYRLVPHPLVLYNIALVYANSGNPVGAVEALEQLQLAKISELGEHHAAYARRVYGAQLARVGMIEVKTNVDHARIQIDGFDAGRTPGPPLRVSAGAHLISVSAPGYEPRRFQATVAGQATEIVTVALVPLRQELAHLKVISSLADVEVRAQGELLGRTPLGQILPLKPGTYDIELTREGYLPVRQRLSLTPGGVGVVRAGLVPSSRGLSSGGTLRLAISESDAVLSVDGEPRPNAGLGVRLPVGRHSIRVRRSGFFDIEREVFVRPGLNRIDVKLLPTAEYLARYKRGAQVQRTWSHIALGVGAVAATSGATFLVWNQREKRRAEERFDDYVDQVAATPAGRCTSDSCADTLDILVDELDVRRKRDVWGWSGIGVGMAGIGTGVLLRVLGPDPRRYDPRPESDVFASVSLDRGGGRFEAAFQF